MPNMPAEPRWESLRVTSPGARVDRENRVIRGFVVAQRGPFKSRGRGQFDDASLARIVELMNASPSGLKSRFTHPDMSSDGLGKFLGRARGARLDAAAGVPAVRADLHLDPSSFRTPNGDLGTYVMDLAESDPDALSSSLVLQTDKEYLLEPDGTRKKDERGEPLPPVWRPTRLHASDVVDTGDAVDGLLSADGIDVDDLPLSALWRGAELLDRVFHGQPRDVVESRLRAYVDRYLSERFPAPEGGGCGTDRLRRRMRLAELAARDLEA